MKPETEKCVAEFFKLQAQRRLASKAFNEALRRKEELYQVLQDLDEELYHASNLMNSAIEAEETLKG